MLKKKLDKNKITKIKVDYKTEYENKRRIEKAFFHWRLVYILMATPSAFVKF
jgi:hypothetical protein